MQGGNSVSLIVESPPPPGTGTLLPPQNLRMGGEQPVEELLPLGWPCLLWDDGGSSGSVDYLGVAPNGEVVFQAGFQDVFVLMSSDTGPQPCDEFTFGDVICFLAGTRIATPEGEVPVEALRPGDPVLTADGRSVPVRFVGRKTAEGGFDGAARRVPVRIRAGALDEAVPRRDLLLPPDHAVALGGSSPSPRRCGTA